MSKKNKGQSWWRSSSSNSSSGSYKSSFFDWDKWTGKNSWTPPVKKQIVKPYMGWWDANKLTRGVYGDTEFIKQTANTQVKKIIGNQQDVSSSQLFDKTKNLYQDMVPDHLVEDIYSIYYNKSHDLEFTKMKDSNKVKFKILEKVNNSLLKIVSNNNSVASFMYTKEIAQFLFNELLNQLTPEEMQQIQNSMKDSNKDSEQDKEEENEESDGNGKGSGKGKGNSKKKGGSNSKKNPSKDQKSEDDTDENEGEGSESDNEDGDKDDSGKGNSGKGSDQSDSKNDEESEEDSDDEQGDEEDGDNESDSSTEGQSSSGSQSSGKNSKGSSKSGSRSNPLSGHNAKEDTSGVKDWKEQNAKNQKQPTREEALAQKIENIFSKQDVQQRFEQAIMKADQLMGDLEKAGIDLQGGKNGLEQIAEIANLKQVRNDIAALTMNKQAIAESIKQILDNSKNYFSKKYKLKEVDLLEADEIDEIYGIEYIHPIFRGLMIDRLSTDEKKYQGKIDLFIDVSGSMSSGSGIPGVSNLLFAKSIALAMFNMDLLNNLYTFDTRVTKIEISELNILMIGFGGGTSIETVVQHVINVSKNNAICLTDGEDYVQTYDDRMFFMGTIGVMFRYFTNKQYSGEAGLKYIENRQCINFDGNKSTLITPELLKSNKMWYGD